MDAEKYDVAIIGAGNIGIAAAFYLCRLAPGLKIALVESETPMSFTSAVSGENYRNWWPHPVMKQFMDRSIALLDELDAVSNQKLILSRNGYLLATRDDNPYALLENLAQTFDGEGELRVHDTTASSLHDYGSTTTGVDVLQNQEYIQSRFARFDPKIKTIVHIRKGGCIATQQLGSYMLAGFKASGGTLIQGEATDFTYSNDFEFSIVNSSKRYRTESLVNAAGPFANELSKSLGIILPVDNVFQQKIAFADTVAAIDRDLPFTIDLDSQYIDWTAEERQWIADDDHLSYLAGKMSGSIHCRPDGPIDGSRIKIGWAYNTEPASPLRTPELDTVFPEIALRGAARLHPSLKAYYSGFPKEFVHYGGYYTMTPENWPLIGSTPLSGYFVSTAMSGFGSMAACAAGELIAQTIVDRDVPDYAKALSLERYEMPSLMQEIAALESNGVL